MPVATTYPGVYIQEKSSGVRTITGVSTSVTAFLGAAASGPINKAVHVQGFAAFEKAFGGLVRDSEMGYAVQQFFANGGADAWVVRVAGDAVAAALNLLDGGAKTMLTLTALTDGAAGNNIEVQVDYATALPDSTFNLTLSYWINRDDPAPIVVETFPNLSMNSADDRYVLDVVNGTSKLVTVERVADVTALAAVSGTSTSADLPTLGGLRSDAHNRFRVSVNGLSPVTVTLSDADMADLDKLAAAITAQVNGNGTATDPALKNFKAAKSGTAIVLTSGAPGENSSVRVLPGLGSDLSAGLKLGVANGGKEADAVAAIRPAQIPVKYALTSGTVAALPGLNDSKKSILVAINNSRSETITFDAKAVTDLGKLAASLQDQVRARRPLDLAFKGFTAQFDSVNQNLVLTSGLGGSHSNVAVSNATTPGKPGTSATPDTLADDLKLTTAGGATGPKPAPVDVFFTGGFESPVTVDNQYGAFVGNPGAFSGLYALEKVDLFNLMCIPGVTDPGILGEAVNYCEKRRAFLIVDAPANPTKSPDDMASYATGSSLPKSANGAVYYPWVNIPDPLNNGKLRPAAPCGTVAGICARTDVERGVWKAPAGTDARLNNVQALEYQLTDAENGILNPHGVNCLRLFPVFGPVVWGARTLLGDDQQASEWKYVPIRRLALFIEESLFRGTKWVVFEPNDEPLWAQIRLNIGAFMHTLFRQGAFQGSSPQQAYFVKCDAETTTQNDIDAGVVNVLVGFAPLKPAEFVIITIQQIAGNIQV